MNRQEFQTLIKNTPLFLDGATGSNLQKQGMPAGVCPEQWILEHRDIMIRLQRDFVSAGSDIVYAPTFTSNRIKLNRTDQPGSGRNLQRGGRRESVYCG